MQVECAAMPGRADGPHLALKELAGEALSGGHQQPSSPLLILCPLMPDTSAAWPACCLQVPGEPPGGAAGPSVGHPVCCEGQYRCGGVPHHCRMSCI